MKTELEIAVEALEEIVSPIKFMQDRLQKGEQLNGMMAVQLSKDPNHLQSIAKKALEAITPTTSTLK